MSRRVQARPTDPEQLYFGEHHAKWRVRQQARRERRRANQILQTPKVSPEERKDYEKIIEEAETLLKKPDPILQRPAKGRDVCRDSQPEELHDKSTESWIKRTDKEDKKLAIRDARLTVGDVLQKSLKTKRQHRSIANYREGRVKDTWVDTSIDARRALSAFIYNLNRRKIVFQETNQSTFGNKINTAIGTFEQARNLWLDTVDFKYVQAFFPLRKWDIIYRDIELWEPQHKSCKAWPTAA